MDQILFGVSDAAEAGRMTGRIGALLFGVWGVAKCYSISRRSTTNRKCVFSLMFLCVAFALNGLGQLFTWTLPPAASVMVNFINAILMFGCMAASVVLAIMGLVEYSRQPGQFVQGRAQAIWALVLATLMVVFGILGFSAARTGRYAARDQARPGETLTLAEYNFQFSAPAKPWVKADAAKLNRDARVAFIRGNPEVIFLIIAEPVGPLLTRETFTELATKRLQTVAASARVIWQREEIINDLAGRACSRKRSLGLTILLTCTGSP